MDGYLVDTSVFIAAEQRRPAGKAPTGRARVSVVTLTELLIGEATASRQADRTLRSATVSKARSFIPLAYDEHVSAALAPLLVMAKQAKRRAEMADAIIAATALVHDLVVWTRDEDFEVLAEVEPRLRVQRA